MHSCIIALLRFNDFFSFRTTEPLFYHYNRKNWEQHWIYSVFSEARFKSTIFLPQIKKVFASTEFLVSSAGFMEIYRAVSKQLVPWMQVVV